MSAEVVEAAGQGAVVAVERPEAACPGRKRVGDDEVIGVGERRQTRVALHPAAVAARAVEGQHEREPLRAGGARRVHPRLADQSADAHLELEGARARARARPARIGSGIVDDEHAGERRQRREGDGEVPSDRARVDTRSDALSRRSLQRRAAGGCFLRPGLAVGPCPRMFPLDQGGREIAAVLRAGDRFLRQYASRGDSTEVHKYACKWRHRHTLVL